MQWESTILATCVTPESVQQTTTRGTLPDRIKWRLLYLDLEETCKNHRKMLGRDPDMITIILERVRFQPAKPPSPEA